MYGPAEDLLGQLTSRWRRRMILASKAGILPPSRSFILRAVSRSVRILHKAVPALAAHVPIPRSRQFRFGMFSLPVLRRSIETSLRELRTDHLDVLLLHECTEGDVEGQELLEFLYGLQREGKIIHFGLATGIEETVVILDRFPAYGGVVQIPSSIWDGNIGRLPARPRDLTVTHSTLSGQFATFLAGLSRDQALARAWRSATGVDPHDTAAVGRLFLAHALQANPGGVVLFFSSKPDTIRENAKLAREPAFEASQFEGLKRFIAQRSGHPGWT